MKELINEDLNISEEAFRIAKENGISRKNVRQRYWDYGWEIEKAISESIVKFADPIWPLWKDIATQNGVSSVLFNVRIGKKYNMTPEQAATTPVKSRGPYKKSTKGRGKYGTVSNT